MPGDQQTGVAVLTWRLFGIRTVAIAAAALRGNTAARMTIVPVQIADQVVMLEAWRTNAIAACTARLELAVSAVLTALSIAAGAPRPPGDDTV